MKEVRGVTLEEYTRLLAKEIAFDSMDSCSRFIVSRNKFEDGYVYEAVTEDSLLIELASWNDNLNRELIKYKNMNFINRLKFLFKW